MPSVCAVFSFCFRKLTDAGSSPAKTAPKNFSGLGRDFNCSKISCAIFLPSIMAMPTLNHKKTEPARVRCDGLFREKYGRRNIESFCELTDVLHGEHARSLVDKAGDILRPKYINEIFWSKTIRLHKMLENFERRGTGYCYCVVFRFEIGGKDCECFQKVFFLNIQRLL